MESEQKFLQRVQSEQAELIYRLLMAHAASMTIPMEVISLEQFQEVFANSMYWFWRTNKNTLALMNLMSFNAFSRSAEFGAIALVRGEGHAREGFKALAALAFKSMGLHRLFCIVNSDNEPCLKAVEALGMRKEGRTVHSRFKDGKWVDQIHFAVLESERRVWDATYKSIPRSLEPPAEEGAA